MKFFLFLALVFLLVNCQEKTDTEVPDNPEEKIDTVFFFDETKLENLNINDLTSFFGGDELLDYSTPVKYCAGFIDGKGLGNRDGNRIYISVYDSIEMAEKCINYTIKYWPCLVFSGDSISMEQPWWYSECGWKTLFKIQYNTIIEVSCAKGNNFEEVQDLLFSTTKEIADRIKTLSVELK